MTYTYQILGADGAEGELFEVEQSPADPPLLVHPLTGQPVRRVLETFNLSGQHNERAVRNALNSTETLSRLGFARYEKDRSTGQYHKTNGSASAPDSF